MFFTFSTGCYQTTAARDALAQHGETLEQIYRNQKNDNDKREFQKKLRHLIYEIDKDLEEVSERLKQVSDEDETALIGAFLYALLYERFFVENNISEEVFDEIRDMQFMGALLKKHADCRQQVIQRLPSETVTGIRTYADHIVLLPLLDRLCRWSSIKEMLPSYPRLFALVANLLSWGWAALCLLGMWAGCSNAQSFQEALLEPISILIVCIIFGLVSVGVIRWIGRLIQKIQWISVKSKLNSLARPMGIAFDSMPNKSDIDQVMSEIRPELSNRGIDTERPDADIKADFDARMKWFEEMTRYYKIEISKDEIFSHAGYIGKTSDPVVFRGQDNLLLPIARGAARGGWIGLKVGAAVASVFASILLLIFSFGSRDD